MTDPELVIELRALEDRLDQERCWLLEHAPEAEEHGRILYMIAGLVSLAREWTGALRYQIDGVLPEDDVEECGCCSAACDRCYPPPR